MKSRNYRKPPKNEAELERRVRDWCKDNGWKRKKMSSPGSKGTLDDYFINGGRHVWIEMKHGSNTPTELQWTEINDIRDHGGEAYWCNSLEQVIWILEQRAMGAVDLATLVNVGFPPQEEWQC
jgi:hypothetical protein